MQIRNPGAPCDNGRGRFASFCFASEYLITSRKEFSAAVVAAGPQIVVTSADRVAFLELGRRLVGKPVGDGAVRVVPAIVVAGSDVPGAGDDLAEESAAIFGRAKQSGGLEPEFLVVLEEQSVCSGIVGQEGLRLRRTTIGRYRGNG